MFNTLKKRIKQTAKTIQPIKQESDRAGNVLKILNISKVRGQ